MIRDRSLRRAGILTAISLLFLSVALFAIDAPPGGDRIYAATFAVTTTTDAVDVAPGDGLCATAAGDCSLRAAVQEANALAGADLITLPAGVYRLTIPGTLEDDGLTGDIDIRDDLVIEGAGAETTRLDAARIDRYLDAPSTNVPVTITLRDLTIENGMAITGGGIRVASGDLTIEDAGLINNIANDANRGNGGGVHIARGEALVVSGSVIRGNSAHTGGGIASSGVETTITNTTIADNNAEQGGGVQVADASLIADAITVSGNSAEVGGGLQTFRSAMHISNSTISGNSSSNVVKGAGLSFGGGVSTLSHVTVVGNTGGYGLGGTNNTVNVENSVIANNRQDCDTDRFTVVAPGPSLDSDGTCGVGITANPLLGGLADNGGPTATHALSAGSPAIDAATGICPGVDQRGVSRPQGSACDLGAYEFEPAAVPEPGPTRRLNLLRGFALLGWTGPDTPVGDAIASIAGAVGGVWTWEQRTELFLFFSPTALAFLNTLEVLRFGDGFWILLTRDVVWEMPVALP